jgi:hypothetical protein
MTVPTLRQRLVPNLTLVLALIVSIIAWLPLVLAGQTPAVAATTPVPDQRAEIQIGTDAAGDSRSGPTQLSAPHFTPLCDSKVGLWAQTVTAGMTARLSEVQLLLLRRVPDIEAPVHVEIRAVDAASLPTETVLGHGSTQSTIPVHRAEPGWLTVPLDAPVQLLRGQKVGIFPTSSPSASGACYEWVSGGLDTYFGGSLAASFDGGATFALENGKDAAFRTWTR